MRFGIMPSVVEIRRAANAVLAATTLADAKRPAQALLAYLDAIASAEMNEVLGAPGDDVVVITKPRPTS